METPGSPGIADDLLRGHPWMDAYAAGEVGPGAGAVVSEQEETAIRDDGRDAPGPGRMTLYPEDVGVVIGAAVTIPIREHDPATAPIHPRLAAVFRAERAEHDRLSTHQRGGPRQRKVVAQPMGAGGHLMPLQRLAERRDSDRGDDRQDGDHHDRFDQRESRAAAAHFPALLGWVSRGSL